MLQVHQNFRVPPSDVPRREQIREQLLTGKITIYPWFLLTAPKQDGILEIVPYYMSRAAKEELRVLGAAPDRQAALKLLQELVEEVHHDTGGFDICQYIEHGTEGQKTENGKE